MSRFREICFQDLFAYTPLMFHGDLLGERSRLTPLKTALVAVSSGERLSYAALNTRAEICASIWLHLLGLQKGDRIAILSGNRVEFLDAFFAAGKAGVIIVPLNTRLTAHELAYILRDCGVSAVMYAAHYRETVKELKARVPTRHWIALDEADEISTSSYSDLREQNAGKSAALPHCQPEDPYALLYTSGTTGKPKGVIIPHRMVTFNAYSTALCWQLREDDVSPIFTPLYHAGGLGAFLTPIIAIGGTVVLHESFNAAEVWRVLQSERCTVALGVPTIYKMLMDAPEFASADLSAIRWLISGGAPLPHYLIAEYQKRGVVFKQGFGMTEAGVNCFSMTAEESVRKAGSIGKPMMFCEARLIDEGGREVKTGDSGELLLRGPHICKGYWNQPEATASAIDAEGWLHTGDVAKKDEEGFFYIAGRRKEMFISGGVNIYPAEIEGELLQHPGVKEAAVVGVPHETWGEAGVAFVVPAGAPLDAAELQGFLEKRLARYKLPREFVFVTEVPRTPMGKIVRGALKEQYAAMKGPR